MDPELLQLFMSAKGNNKNVSGLLNNLDNPLLAYLAGVYDPVSAGAGNAGGPLWAQYANSQEPIIQDLVGQIQGGMDEFALNSYIDSLVNDEKTRPLVSSSGFQVGDLKGLAKALQKEYAGTASGSGGSGGKQDMWSKAGLRNPLDLYSTEDVPMGAASRADLQGIQSGRMGAEKNLSDTRAAWEFLKKNQDLDSEETKKSKERKGDPRERVLREFGEPLYNLISGKTIADFLVDNAGEVRGTMLGGQAKDVFGGREQPGYGKQEKTPKRSTAPAEKKKQQKYTKSQYDLGSASMQSDASNAAERLYREGMLDAYNAAGKTPTRDQLAGIMKFLSGQK